MHVALCDQRIGSQLFPSPDPPPLPLSVRRLEGILDELLTTTWCRQLPINLAIKNIFTSLLLFKGVQVLFGLLFLFSIFYCFTFTSSSLCCITNSMMKPQQKNVLKSDFPLFSYGYWKCTFVNPFIQDTCTLKRLHLSSVLSHGEYYLSFVQYRT